jgi:hypothetical protein
MRHVLLTPCDTTARVTCAKILRRGDARAHAHTHARACMVVRRASGSSSRLLAVAPPPLPVGRSFAVAPREQRWRLRQLLALAPPPLPVGRFDLGRATWVMCHAMDGWMRVPATRNHRKAREQNMTQVSLVSPASSRRSRGRRRPSAVTVLLPDTSVAQLLEQDPRNSRDGEPVPVHIVQSRECEVRTVIPPCASPSAAMLGPPGHTRTSVLNTCELCWAGGMRRRVRAGRRRSGEQTQKVAGRHDTPSLAQRPPSHSAIGCSPPAVPPARR